MNTLEIQVPIRNKSITLSDIYIALEHEITKKSSVDNFTRQFPLNKQEYAILLLTNIIVYDNINVYDIDNNLIISFNRIIYESLVNEIVRVIFDEKSCSC